MENKSEYIFRVLKQASDILNSTPDLWKEVCETIKNSDLELSDIQHELEFVDFDKDKGFELATEIKQIRQLRRIAKEDQIILVQLKDFFEKNLTFSKRLQDLTESLEKEMKAKRKRVYKPKIRTEKMEIIYKKNDEIHAFIDEEDKVLVEQPVEEHLIAYEL